MSESTVEASAVDDDDDDEEEGGARDGGAPDSRQLWLRYTVATLTPAIGLLWACFEKERRALYDLAAGTAFVRLRPLPKS